MLIKLLGNKFIGISGVILSLLVFNLGIALPLYSLSLSKKAAENQEKNILADCTEEEGDFGDEIPFGDEEDQRTPTPGAEEEDEKSKETHELWNFADITSDQAMIVEETHAISHRPYEVTTPPPEA